MSIQTQLKPNYGAGYSLAVSTGALTLVVANGAVWSCRWTSTTHVAIVQKISYSVVTTTAFGAAQDLSYGLYFARAYTITDTGGTASTLTTNNGKLDTRNPLTQMADIRVATTLAIVNGTRTLDAHPLRATAHAGAAAVAATGDEWNFNYPISPPLILRTDEGLVMNNLVLMGAAGVATLRVCFEWIEVNRGLV
jgi:hypothetical protein